MEIFADHTDLHSNQPDVHSRILDTSAFNDNSIFGGVEVNDRSGSVSIINPPDKSLESSFISKTNILDDIVTKPTSPI